MKSNGCNECSVPDLDGDEALLLRCLRAAYGMAPPADPAAYAKETLDSAVRMAMQNVVLSVMDKGLIGGLEAIDTPRSRRRRGDYWAVTIARNTAILDHAAKITADLDEAGIAHAYFKGPLQQQQLHGDAFLRPCGDLDLLVKSRDVPRTAARLSKAGHRAHDGMSLWWLPFLGERHFTSANNRCIIDLHRSVQQPGLPQPRDIGEIIAATERMPIRNASVPVVNPDDHMVILACNISKGLFTRTRTVALVCDLRTALGSDWQAGFERCVNACRRRHVEHTGRLALNAVATLFGERGQHDHAFEDEALLRSILNPANAESWPRRRAISSAACGRDTLVRSRVGLWYLASEAVRGTSSLWQKTDPSS